MWYAFIYSLAKSDITKFEQILQMNFIFTLNMKSFESENKPLYERYNKH